jgi:hypothetical protein
MGHHALFGSKVHHIMEYWQVAFAFLLGMMTEAVNGGSEFWRKLGLWKKRMVVIASIVASLAVIGSAAIGVMAVVGRYQSVPSVVAQIAAEHDSLVVPLVSLIPEMRDSLAANTLYHRLNAAELDELRRDSEEGHQELMDRLDLILCLQEVVADLKQPFECGR